MNAPDLFTDPQPKEGSMNAIAKREEEPRAIQVADTNDAAMMALIAKAASDPNFDADKMDRLLQMQERLMDRRAVQEFNRAFTEMQPKLPVIDRKGRILIQDKQGNVTQNTPYAKWEDIDRVIKPIYTAHGFSLSFKPGVAADGKMTITAVLRHVAGHQDEATVTLPYDSSGSKNNVQAVGSSNTYGKRYAACDLLNIVTEGQDDDGKAAGEPEWVTTEQLGELQELMDSVNADRAKFLGFFKIETIAHLPAKRFGEAVKMLQAKGARR
jgi:hypothetical protein